MRLLRLLPFVFLLVLLYGCAEEKDFPEAQSYPIIRTLEAIPDSIGTIVRGQIVRLGREPVTEYGFEYSAFGDTKKVTKQVVGTTASTGEYEAKLNNNLVKGYTYTLRAYAKHGQNTTYGTSLSFKSQSTAIPAIHSFSPKAAEDNRTVTIYGKNFGEESYLVKVTIGDAKADVMSVHRDSVIIRTPIVPYSGSFPLSMTVRGEHVTAKEQFEIIGPHISHLSASSGRPGDELIIYGKNLSYSGFGTYVTIGGQTANILSQTNTSIRVRVPMGTPNTYDRALSVSVYRSSKTAVLPYSYTLQSGFTAASSLPTTTGVSSTRLPSFVAEGKAFFFSFDRVISHTIASSLWKNEGMFPGIHKYNSIFERVGDKGYLIGGRNGNMFYGDVWEYDYRQNTWTKLKSLPFAVHSATSFVLNGKIHFFGGQNSSSTVKVWQYDPATETVVALNNFPVSTSGGYSFESNGTVYVMLGIVLWAYNAQQDSWSQKASLPGLSSFTNTQAYTYQNEGYAIALRDEYALYRYDAIKNGWTKVAWYPGCTSTATFYGFASEDRLYIGTVGSCSYTLYSYEEP
ncbi:IPT/TIG domain-containing protein [Pontibacter ramchanderi]|uniref:IPT/TIG domain-containing protein n=1 Tax=Pontibacter ramchanderi TaxID=1179743 RepID=A0A2N3UB53_9BACT|nr:IPT/TIG domain-containing protein [Pontibacter ramchanderi]PKV66565.1 IPT/TIG domain-containing protein [Pontibacter ramchanderi]